MADQNRNVQIPAEILAAVRRIEIRTRRLVEEVFSGEYHSVFKGTGMEFREVREYVPGDDVRAIDANAQTVVGEATNRRQAGHAAGSVDRDARHAIEQGRCVAGGRLRGLGRIAFDASGWRDGGAIVFHDHPGQGDDIAAVGRRGFGGRIVRVNAERKRSENGRNERSERERHSVGYP